MTSEQLALISGGLLSLAFSYIPNLNIKYDALEPVYKRLVMLVLLAVVAGVVFGLSCTPLGADLGLSVSCDQQGAIGLVGQFFLALMANQAIYLAFPKAPAVEAARAAAILEPKGRG